MLRNGSWEYANMSAESPEGQEAGGRDWENWTIAQESASRWRDGAGGGVEVGSDGGGGLLSEDLPVGKGGRRKRRQEEKEEQGMHPREAKQMAKTRPRRSIAPEHGTTREEPVLGPVQWQQLSLSTQQAFLMAGSVGLVLYHISYDAFGHQTSTSCADPLQGNHTSKQVIQDCARLWTKDKILAYRARAKAGLELVTGYCGATKFMRDSLAAFPVRNRSALVVGSIHPWAESLLLVAGVATPIITVDYNPPVSFDSQVQTVSVQGLREQTPRPQFDVCVSYSSIEHDGLGRYGDPVDPDGDLASMAYLSSHLRPGGLLFLSVPVGQDVVVFNAHRIYGPVRLPRLLGDLELLAVFGSGQGGSVGRKDLKRLFRLPPSTGMIGDCGQAGQRNWEQPVLVLCKPPGCPPALIGLPFLGPSRTANKTAGRQETDMP